MEGKNRRRCVWGERRSESRESRSSDALSIEREMCVFKTEFEQADLAKKRVALFGRKQSLDDRLNMVFVNLTIGAGLVNKWQGTSGRLCSLKQPQNQANRPARPFIYIYTTRCSQKLDLSSLCSSAAISHFGPETNLNHCDNNFDARSASSSWDLTALTASVTCLSVRR